MCLGVHIEGCVQALSASVTEEELSADNAAVGVVGEGMPFTILEGEALQPYLDALKSTQDAGPGGNSKLPFAAILSGLLYCIGKEHKLQFRTHVPATAGGELLHHKYIYSVKLCGCNTKASPHQKRWCLS